LVHQALRKLFRAIGSANLELLQSVALPNPDLYLLVQHRPTAGDLAALDDKLDHDLQPHVLGGDNKTRMSCRAMWRGSLVPVLLVKTPAGWRADLRWWTAGAKAQHPAYDAARGFMFALMTADLDLLQQIAVDDVPNLDLLIQGQSRPPGGEMGQYEHVAQTLPVIELSADDTYPSSRGTLEPVRADWLADDRKLLLVQYLDTEIPLQARLSDADGRWHIDPTILLATIARRMQEAQSQN
ncbi:MAG TPA: hypothetical protein VK986_14720, partial [Tepidisphaeraceae bacterium]|nr:hypothetical protein [Tepidisphaeraceae bacterium]